jgi:hypothetical protein
MPVVCGCSNCGFVSDVCGMARVGVFSISRPHPSGTLSPWRALARGSQNAASDSAACGGGEAGGGGTAGAGAGTSADGSLTEDSTATPAPPVLPAPDGLKCAVSGCDFNTSDRRPMVAPCPCGHFVCAKCLCVWAAMPGPVPCLACMAAATAPFEVSGTKPTTGCLAWTA